MSVTLRIARSPVGGTVVAPMADRAAEEAFTDRDFHKTVPLSARRPGTYECRPDLGSISRLNNHAVLPRFGRVPAAATDFVPATRVGLDPGATLVTLRSTPARVAMIAAGAAERMAGDVQALPSPDATFDLVLTMHMLYHVPDLTAAVRELRRILRQGGRQQAFTNS